MILLRVVGNGLIMAFEIGAVLAAAALGYRHPFVFAAVTAALAFLLGLWLETARLGFELPFYFGRSFARTPLLARAIAAAEAIVKGVLAGFVSLLTFAGTDAARLWWVAAIFAACVWAGANLLRWLSIRFGVVPARWGYFRLAALLGLMFAIPASLIPVPSFADIGLKVIFDLPARPRIAQTSELLFVLKQKFDEMIVALAAAVVAPDLARAIGTVVSVNVLTGFIVAVYAVAVAESVRRLERLLP
jgi:hypothetical protein